MKRSARFLVPVILGFLLMPSALWAEPVVMASVQSDEGGVYAGQRFPLSVAETAAPAESEPSRHVRRQADRAAGSSDGDAPERPLWRSRFFSDVLGPFRALDAYRLMAALRMLNKVHARKMRLVDYRFSDVNGDGMPEVTVITEVEGDNGVALRSLGVYAFDEYFEPHLRYERQLSAGAAERYEQSLAPRDIGIGFCEDWRVTTWEIHECHDIVFDRVWRPWVSRHEIRTSEAEVASSQGTVFDFMHRRASRSYERLPDGPFMPPLRRHAGYDMILAPYDGSIAEPSALRVSRTTAGGAHAPVAYAVSWNRKGVYYAFEFRDDDIRVPEACGDMIAIQKVDHAEFWFDLEPSLEVSRDAPQSWQLEYEQNYRSEPYRHSLDQAVFGMAVTADGCVVPMSPTRDYWPVHPKVTVLAQNGGYRVEMFMPSEFYGVSDMHALDRSVGLSFTALQHDVHSDRSWDTVSTSDWQWPDPFTFAQIWLLPEGGTSIPPFPLQWRTWLVDN